MKKFYTIFLCALLCAFLCINAFAQNKDNAMRDVEDAVSTAGDMAEDLVTDLKDAVDPDGDGDPEAEGDGIVDDKDTALDNNGTSGGTTNEQPSTENNNRDTSDDAQSRDTTDNTQNRDTTGNSDETTGVIEGMELEEKGINPWAIVIAVIVVIAVLILIFILIPKRRR